MILYHPNGEALVLNPAVWRTALQLAESAGWQPGGTLPPPSDLERQPVPWHRAYEPALGQQVTRTDAAALAAALHDSVEWDPHSRRELRSLADFCRRGGFLICSSPGISDSLANLAAHTGTSTESRPVTPDAHAPEHPLAGGQGANSQPG